MFSALLKRRMSVRSAENVLRNLKPLNKFESG